MCTAGTGIGIGDGTGIVIGLGTARITLVEAVELYCVYCWYWG